MNHPLTSLANKTLVVIATIALMLMSFTPRAVGFWCECRHDFAEQAECAQDNCHPAHDHVCESDHDHQHDDHSHQTVEKSVDLTPYVPSSSLPPTVFFTLPLDFPLITHATRHSIDVESDTLLRAPDLPLGLTSLALIRSTVLVI